MLALIKAIAEPPVQHWSYPARFATHTAIWTTWLIFMQYAVFTVVSLLREVGVVKRSARSPSVPTVKMLWHDTFGYIGWAWPLGLFAAWLNPGAPGGWNWDYSFPNIILVMYFALATLMAFDAYSFFMHRWLHVNKTAFLWLHAKHHEHQAVLDSRTAGYMSLEEGILSDALPLLCIYALGSLTGNWWYSFAGMWNAFHIVMTGHCGHLLTLTNILELPVLLLNPMALAYVGCPVRATPKVHEDHHMYPRYNFSYFFTFWDDWYNTSRTPNPPSTLLLLSIHAVWQLQFLLSIHLLVQHAPSYLAAWLLAYILVTPSAAVAVSEALALPEGTRRVLGWLMDAVRKDNYVTFTPPGQPGAFKLHSPHPTIRDPSWEDPPIIPADDTAACTDDTCGNDAVSRHTQHNTSAAAAAAANLTQAGAEQPGTDASDTAAAAVQSSKPSVYLFACHPTGLFSRAAFFTFGARGWQSPVSSLPRVRLAVGSVLLKVPLLLSRELLLACGCIPADWCSIKGALQSGSSVALTPGGWRESRYLQTHNLVLKKRRGFVALAAETGAVLVPVLCMGEEGVVGAVEPGYLWLKWLIPWGPHKLHVVFGEPVAPEPQEPLSHLHSRYVQALMDLGKQHGVQLSIVE